MQRGAVAVFGSSDPAPGSPAYRLAQELGRELARAGFGVVTGGYGGVMEAASRGAHEAGGETLGVTCRIFGNRQPNAYLTRHVSATDLHERTRLLIDGADAFVILDGRAGTLAELAFLWALDRAGCLGGRPVILLAGAWESLMHLLTEADLLDAGQLRTTLRARTPKQVSALLNDLPATPRNE